MDTASIAIILSAIGTFVAIYSVYSGRKDNYYKQLHDMYVLMKEEAKEEKQRRIEAEKRLDARQRFNRNEIKKIQSAQVEQRKQILKQIGKSQNENRSG